MRKTSRGGYGNQYNDDIKFAEEEKKLPLQLPQQPIIN
jgi:hypothetical protein